MIGIGVISIAKADVPIIHFSGDSLRSQLAAVVWTPNDGRLIHLADELHETASSNDALPTQVISALRHSVAETCRIACLR